MYEFTRSGRLIATFETPAELLPGPGTLDFVAARDGAVSGAGRQDNRGYEGWRSANGDRFLPLAGSPAGRGPRSNASDTTDNDGRDGRHVRIVVFETSPEPQLPPQRGAVRLLSRATSGHSRRIAAAGGTASGSDPRQGRNIGLSGRRDQRPYSWSSNAITAGSASTTRAAVASPVARFLHWAWSAANASIASTPPGATDVSALVLPDDGDLAAAASCLSINARHSRSSIWPPPRCSRTGTRPRNGRAGDGPASSRRPRDRRRQRQRLLVTQTGAANSSMSTSTSPGLRPLRAGRPRVARSIHPPRT